MELHTASGNDKQLFHRLIKRQRNQNSTATTVLKIGNETYEDDLLPAWTKHFSNLAQPTQYGHHVQDLKIQCKAKIEDIKITSEPNIEDLPLPITAAEVVIAINSLNRKKASDEYGLSAEHLQMHPHAIAEFLTPIINMIIKTSSIPNTLKTGTITPVHKKSKDKEKPGNYRGITITPILSKVLEKIIKVHQKESTKDTDHPLQFGFTEGKSMSHAAFLVSEALNEAKDRKIPIFAATLDVEKAFDVVNHTILLAKLHEKGLRGRFWRLKEDAYQGMVSKIKWQDRISDPFEIQQGTRQGGITSTDDYLIYLHDGIEQLVQSRKGVKIGSTNIIAPTCAIDMIIMSTDETELQELLTMITNYANSHQYNIHPEKSHVIPFNLPSSCQIEAIKELKPWTINNRNIPVNSQSTHLGIDRTTNSASVTVDARLQTARSTLYALLGAGLHGLNGLPIATSVNIYKVYVIPRLIYGLETISISKPKMRTLEMFHKTTLRRITGLPERTAIPALHIITGLPTIESMIHLKMLSLLHSMLCSPGPAQAIILRQYAVKTKSFSWTQSMKEILQEYDLPTIADIYTESLSKDEWKKRTKSAVMEHETLKLEKEADSKSTLIHLHNRFQPYTAHRSAGLVNSARDVTRVAIKLRLLTGTYLLQKSLFKLKKSSTSQ